MVDAGHSDQEIRQFLQDRYGDFVLYKPPLRTDTALLWFGPLIFVLIGLLLFWRLVIVRGQQPGDSNLDAQSQARVASLLESTEPAEGEHQP